MRRYTILIIALLLSYVSMAQQAESAVATQEQVSSEQNATEQKTAEQKAEALEEFSAEKSWDAANKAYQEADYKRAETLYRAILEQGLHSAKLYYNLANTLFKQEKLGEAILYYNKALRLSPADEDVRHNLEYAENSTKDSIEQIPEFFLFAWIRAVRNLMSCDGWTIFSLVILVIGLAAALFYLLAQRISTRKAGFYVMVLAALLFLVATLFANYERKAIVNHNEAIVMSSAVSVKSSPDRAATELFVLHEGTKLSIGERMDGWVEVRIADGRKGWIESSRIAEI
ncbi:MAG: tetratricopeptide repeat protein [Alistipes sp.]|nr:tetratricopeptide repeat protein [Alistipes sp.]